MGYGMVVMAVLRYFIYYNQYCVIFCVNKVSLFALLILLFTMLKFLFNMSTYFIYAFTIVIFSVNIAIYTIYCYFLCQYCHLLCYNLKLFTIYMAYFMPTQTFVVLHCQYCYLLPVLIQISRIRIIINV